MVNISSGLCWPLSKRNQFQSDKLHSKIIGNQEGIVSAGQDSMVCFGLLTDLMDSTGASESRLQEGKMQMEIQEDSVTLKKKIKYKWEWNEQPANKIWEWNGQPAAHELQWQGAEIWYLKKVQRNI